MTVFPAIFALFMAVLVSGQDQVVEIRPKYAVRRVGDHISVVCKVPYKLDSCRIIVGTETYRLTDSTATEEIEYSGRGLEVGECGARLKNIKEEWNGNVSCVVPPQSGIREVGAAMRLVVASPPGDPELRTPQQEYFQEGDEYTAECVVPNGRPAAKITWYLDEEELAVGVHAANVTAGAGGLETVQQAVTRELGAADAGRRLTCAAHHEAFDRPRNASVQLVVHYPPRLVEGSDPLTIFGLRVGAEARLNVTVRASPAPAAEWTVGAQRLQPGQSNDARTAHALPPLPLGEGRYNLTLVLHQVAKEDVEQTYQLQVGNHLGSQLITVRISTMDEPAGVELETGAIVGIVVAVLVLLLALSLAVFARATDRWCFAGRSHRTDIPDGADSEAPLPPHDDVKGSENPSHDHGDYISNGNSKHPEKKPDTAV